MKLVGKLTAIGAIVFIAIGIVFGFVVPGIFDKKEARCTYETTAVVVDIDVDDDGDSTLYAPVYSYTIDGDEVTSVASVHTNVRPTIGDEKTIFVNPDDHIEIYDPKSDGMFAMIFRIIGYVLLGCAFIPIIISIIIIAAVKKSTPKGTY